MTCCERVQQKLTADRSRSVDQHAFSRRQRRSVVGAQNALGLDGRLAVKRLGLSELPLVAKYVAPIRERHDIVRVIGTQRALDAMGIEIGKMVGVIELEPFP